MWFDLVCEPSLCQVSIRSKLSERFKPTTLEVSNESYMHNVPKGVVRLPQHLGRRRGTDSRQLCFVAGSESHFKVVVVSDAFDGVSERWHSHRIRRV